MTEAQIKAQLSDLQALTCTMIAEAAGDRRDGSSVEERIAVGCVIRNRVLDPGWWGNTYRAVCLKPWMFSCWNPGPDVNHQRTMRLAYEYVTGQPVVEPIVLETQALAELIIDRIVLDCTGGSDHYYAPLAMKPKGAAPKWAKDRTTGVVRAPTAIVGTQHFYRIGKA